MNEQPTLRSLCAKFARENAHRWTRSTLAYRRQDLEKLATYVGDRELTPMILSEFQAEQHLRGYKRNTIARTLTSVNVFIQWAEDMEVFARGRFSRLLTIPKGQRKKPKTFNHAQFERLKEASKGTFWHYAIIMSYRTGARYSDCALLKWENVNLTKCYVQFVPYKTRKTGRQALCPFDPGGDLHQAILELEKTRNPHPMWAPYVCPEMAMYYPMEGVADAGKERRDEFDKLCRQCGAEGLSFHQLRNTFISRLVNSGASAPKGMQLTGLASEDVFTQYAKPDLDELRKVIDNMNRGDEPPDEGTIIKMPGAA